MSNFKTLVDEDPDMFKDLKLYLEKEKARTFCTDWIPHRNWLLANKVALKEYEEEIEY